MYLFQDWQANRQKDRDHKGIHGSAHHNDARFGHWPKTQAEGRTASKSNGNACHQCFGKNNLATSNLEVTFTVEMNVITTYTKHSIKMPWSREGA